MYEAISRMDWDQDLRWMPASIQPPLITEGDLWWCAVGENVGIEVNGKSKDFTRPVIILKKFGRLGFLGIPTTTQHRVGTWYVPFRAQRYSRNGSLQPAWSA